MVNNYSSLAMATKDAKFIANHAMVREGKNHMIYVVMKKDGNFTIRGNHASLTDGETVMRAFRIYPLNYKK